MSPARRRSKQRKPAENETKHPDELFRVMPEPPMLTVAAGDADPTSVLRSLGTPPLAGQAAVAEQELAKVVLRAAFLARGLAGAAGLVDDQPAD